MDQQSKNKVTLELLGLAQTGRIGKDGRRPLELLDSSCPTLLRAIPAFLLSVDSDEDRVRVATTLLTHVSYFGKGEEGRRRAAFGDLLGLTNLPDSRIKEIFNNYRGSDKPKEFVRYNLRVRFTISTRHFNRGIEWARGKYETWAADFASSLCDLLDKPEKLEDELAGSEVTTTSYPESPRLHGIGASLYNPPASPVLEPIPAIAESELRPNPSPMDPSLRQALQQLADVVYRQLEEEHRWWRASDPRPLTVSGAGVPRQFVDQWENIRGDDEQAQPLPLPCKLDDIERIFKSLPSQRLVILGQGGAGKTTLARELALALADPKKRSDDDPVPVFFRLASWKPGQNSPSFDDWIIAQLLRDYEALRSTNKEKETLASQLVFGGHILPILDGFDEIEPDVRHLAIPELNVSLRRCQGLVLTSLSDEFTAAVEASYVLSRAAVVELKSPSLDDIRNYLPLTTRRLPDGSPSHTKWHPVFADLKSAMEQGQEPPLLRVLSTPLMVFLIRSMYSETSANPEELLDPNRFPNASILFGYLFDGFLPVVYRLNPRAWVSRRRETWHLRDSQKWLELLALQIYGLREQSRDGIAWWQLKFSISPRISMLATACKTFLATLFSVSAPSLIFEHIYHREHASIVTIWVLVLTFVALITFAIWPKLLHLLGPVGLLRPRAERFLEDAYRRGVLRREGKAYRFRQELLLDRLVSDALSQPVRPSMGSLVSEARVAMAFEAFYAGRFEEGLTQMKDGLQLELSLPWKRGRYTDTPIEWHVEDSETWVEWKVKGPWGSHANGHCSKKVSSEGIIGVYANNSTYGVFVALAIRVEPVSKMIVEIFSALGMRLSNQSTFSCY